MNRAVLIDDRAKTLRRTIGNCEADSEKGRRSSGRFTKKNKKETPIQPRSTSGLTWQFSTERLVTVPRRNLTRVRDSTHILQTSIPLFIPDCYPI